MIFEYINQKRGDIPLKKEMVAAGLVSLILFITTVQYCWLTAFSDVEPVLASWLLFTVVTSSNWLTYWSSPKRSIVHNIGLVSSCISIWIITSTILVSGFFLGKNIRLGFTQFEIICFLVSAVILLWWKYTKEYEIPNYAFQVLTLIAWFPLYIHLWFTPRNTEPFSLWLVQLVVTGISIIPAVVGKDKFAIINSVRGFLCVVCILLLMIRFELFH